MFQFRDSGREELKRALKFVVTGVGNTVVDFAVFTILAVWLDVNVPLSQFCGYSAGMLNSYLINRSWTFQTKDRFFSLQMARFVVANVAVMLLSMALIQAGIVYLDMSKLLAKLFTTAFTMVVNFLISRLWVFRE